MTERSVSVLSGDTFVVSDRAGDIRPASRHPPHGFFARDTRFLSSWQLSIAGRCCDVLSTAQIDHFAGQFFLVPPTATFHGAPLLSIVRQRVVGETWVEEIAISNHRQEPTEVELALDVEADFADVFDIKEDRGDRRQVVARAGERELRLRYRNGTFVRETHIAVSEPAQIEDDAIRITLRLAPREQRVVRFTVSALAGSERRPAPPGSFERERARLRDDEHDWLADAPRLETDSDPLRHAYERSLDDLAALRFHPHIDGCVDWVPAAGLPWFMTLFGRDSLITSYQALPFLPGLARATLRTLAARQGTRRDDFRDEEPGKILHEIRFGELAETGRVPHSPYYGAADSTPLFLVLLDEYERWTGDAALVRELEPNARAALRWIDQHGDLDGDGYVEYLARNPDTGLVNQCWKDSWNSILFADGRLAEGAIATCEIQGYVYDAKRRAARLAREVWDDVAFADRLQAEAERLRIRFHEDFWLPERGCYALALDGAKQPVDSLTSNIGHLLWSGIADPEPAAQVARVLLEERLFSGWGVRTMAEGDGGYNPVEYHNGTVWPHDNSLIVAGLRRYGHAEQAGRIAGALLDAAPYFAYRLPEVFAGFPRALTHAPVLYPTACSPQAWSAAAPLLLLTALLGLEPGPEGVRSDPQLPPQFGQLALDGVHGPSRRAAVVAG
ncbi:MAG: amylo-alpha-1,6-glucosidase [Conexibacter sp.]